MKIRVVGVVFQKMNSIFHENPCSGSRVFQKMNFIFNENRCSGSRVFQKINFIFHENPCSGSRVPCGRMDGQTDIHITKLIVAFRSFAKATEKWTFLRYWAAACVCVCCVCVRARVRVCVRVSVGLAIPTPDTTDR